MNAWPLLLGIVILGSCLFFIKRGVGCCGMKGKDESSDKKDGCCSK